MPQRPGRSTTHKQSMTGNDIPQTRRFKRMYHNVDATEQLDILLLVVSKVITCHVKERRTHRAQTFDGWRVIFKVQVQFPVFLLRDTEIRINGRQKIGQGTFIQL